MGKHIFWQMKQKSMFWGTVQWERTDGLSPPTNAHYCELTSMIWSAADSWYNDTAQDIASPFARPTKTWQRAIYQANCRLNSGPPKSHKLGCYASYTSYIHQVILYFNKKLRNCEFEISKLQTKHYSQTVETTWTNKSWLIMMLVRLEVWAGQNLQSDRQNELELAHAGSNLITPIAHLAPSGVAPTSGASGLGSSNSWLCDLVWPYASVWLYAHVGQRWSSRSRHACWWLNLSNPNPNKKWIDLVGPSLSKRTMLIWMIWLGGPKSFHKNNNDIIDLKFGEATFIISSHQQDAKDASEAREVHKVKQPVMCKPPVTVLLPCLALLIKW